MAGNSLRRIAHYVCKVNYEIKTAWLANERRECCIRAAEAYILTVWWRDSLGSLICIDIGSVDWAGWRSAIVLTVCIVSYVHIVIASRDVLGFAARRRALTNANRKPALNDWVNARCIIDGAPAPVGRHAYRRWPSRDLERIVVVGANQISAS